ncbi:MAG: hypothetical protein AAGK14_11960 [Verrucomicrobiota bacterium]
MKRSPRTGRKQTRPSRRAIALLMTLASIVLLSGVVLIFLSNALTNRQLSSSSASRIKADALARFAGEVLIGEIRQEMLIGSTVLVEDGFGIFQPSRPEDFAPTKVGVNEPDAVGAFTILKVPGNDQGLSSGGTIRASNVSIDDESVNGRSISAARWFGSGGPQLGSQARMPNWFYVTRDNGVATPPVAGPSAGNSANNPLSENYVIGRFACTIYDVSGLLNVNVAGFPTSAESVAATKGTTAYADLATLDDNFDRSDQDTFARWRNGSSITATGANYQDYLKTVAMPSGFNVSGSDQNAILNRADLLNAARDGRVGLTTAMVPYLTHSNTFLNAPSWLPTNVADSTIFYGDDANEPDSANRFVPNVRFTKKTDPLDADDDILYYNDDGTPVGYDVLAGESLVKRRFSLAKLAWIGYDGPNKEAFDSSLNASEIDKAILACFGLEWNESEFYWDYRAQARSPNRIMTLDEVAQENREPNFFELLQAGILSGSLAKHPGISCGDGTLPPATATLSVVGAAGAYFKSPSPSKPSYSDEPNLHIMQIGANIIDQADADHFPTAIYFPAYLANPDAQEYGFYNIAYGLENLPQLHRIYLTGYEDPNSAPEENHSTLTNFKFWIVPEVWNPNQPPLASEESLPTSFRVRAHGEAFGRFAQDDLKKLGLVGSLMDYDDNGPDGAAEYRDVYFRNRPGLGDPFDFQKNPVTLSPEMLDETVRSTNIHNYFRDGEVPAFDEFNGSVNRDLKEGPDEYFEWAGIYAGSSRWPKDRTVQPWDPIGGKGPKRKDALTFLSLELVPNLLLAFTMEVWDEETSRWLPYAMASRMANYPSTNDYGCQLHRTDPPDWPDRYDGMVNLLGRNAIFTPDPRTDRLSNGFSRRNGGAIVGDGRGVNGWRFAQTAEYSRGGTILQRAIEQYYPRVLDGFEYPGCTPMTGRTFNNKANTAMWLVNLEENSFATSGFNSFYRDPDGVVRPADGFRRDMGNGDGILMLPASSETETAERRAPVILNRPFRSVAELGYAFRDLPGKTLDFWSEQSADAALLDLFTVSGSTQLTLDGFNPNAAPPEVLLAMISGTEAQENPTENIPLFANELEKEDFLQVLVDYLEDEDNDLLTNRSDLVLELGNILNDALPDTNGIKHNKSMAEAPMRALADASQTRTWNLLIDIVAQSGRVTPAASTLTDFVVEGQRRVWLHVSIDRFSGAIVSFQEEPIYE